MRSTALLRRFGPIVCVACCVQSGTAFAARPMATDDTSTANPGDCQIEAWSDQARRASDYTVAPACGISGGLEIDTSFARAFGDAGTASGAAVGLKWVPDGAHLSTGLGELRFGAIAFASLARDPGLDWHGEAFGLAALSSLEPAPGLDLYVNAYVSHRQAERSNAYGARAAVAWSPDVRWLLFVEGLADSRAQRAANAGLRLWVLPNRLGLDLVFSRANQGGNALSLGFGWYELSLR